MELWIKGNVPFAGAHAKQRSFQPLPQPRSLAAALLEMQLTLLGSLMAIVSQANQLQVGLPTSAANLPVMGPCHELVGLADR